MKEEEQEYVVDFVAEDGEVMTKIVDAVSKFHAKQVALAKFGHMQQDPAKYYVHHG